jgi:hypothetical protein
MRGGIATARRLPCLFCRKERKSDKRLAGLETERECESRIEALFKSGGLRLLKELIASRTRMTQNPAAILGHPAVRGAVRLR